MHELLGTKVGAVHAPTRTLHSTPGDGRGGSQFGRAYSVRISSPSQGMLNKRAAVNLCGSNCSSFLIWDSSEYAPTLLFWTPVPPKLWMEGVCQTVRVELLQRAGEESCEGAEDALLCAGHTLTKIPR